MSHKVFISYSSKDKAVANKICNQLEQSGIECWIAPRDIDAGSKYATAITHAIEDCQILLLLFSKNAANSSHVESELEFAFSLRKTIIPCRIDHSLVRDYPEFDYRLHSRHWIDAQNSSNYGELIEVLSELIGVTTTTNESVQVNKVKNGKGFMAFEKRFRYLLLALSLFIPIVGIVFFFLSRKKDKDISKVYLCVGVASWVLNWLLLLGS